MTTIILNSNVLCLILIFVVLPFLSFLVYLVANTICTLNKIKNILKRYDKRCLLLKQKEWKDLVKLLDIDLDD